MAATLRALAERFDCDFRGDPTLPLSRVGTLAAAGPDAVSFLANPKFCDLLAQTRAGAVVLEAKHADSCPTACLIHANPYATFARVAAWLHPPPPARAGVHRSAVVAANAEVADSAEIGPAAIIESGAKIGERVVIGAGSVIGADSTIGADTRIAMRVSIDARAAIGRRCIIHSGAVIGADGFGFALDAGRWVKVPQIGSVEIGDDVEVGANTTIDRGTIENTVVADGVKLDNLVQIAHNVRIGEHTVMAAMSGAAGSTRIGRRCMIGGGAVLINHIEICDDVVLLFRSVVTKSIAKPGVYSGSLPAEEAERWRRNAVRFRQLDKMAGRLLELEQQVGRKHGDFNDD
jgi:UDP-3-O-[3-hydroxymyristoyl] glucosamine N-acyltransferase